MSHSSHPQGPPARSSVIQLVRNLSDRLKAVSWRPIYSLINIANITLIAVVCAGGITAMSFRLQRLDYDEQAFVRNQGSINLAWRTLSEANDHQYEMGQSSALLYLANIGHLQGHLTLINSTIEINTYDSGTAKYTNAFISLDNSALCNDAIANWSGEAVRYGLQHSILRNTKFSGTFSSTDLLGADLRGAKFIDVDMTNMRAAAAMLDNVEFHGGKFAQADFQGATLRGLKTERGFVGAGSPDYDSAYLDTYSDYPGQPVWPILFDKDKGLKEVLTDLGMATSETIRDDYLVDFSGARFIQADLRGAHLEKSNIRQKQVNEACADDSTALPLGVKVEEQCSVPSYAEELRKAIRVYATASSTTACNPE
jgi:uncharacterized protein YjbI with pentapeptide repeats